MTDYEVDYSFQNIRFTDPADFGGKDTLFVIDDLDLSEDEKEALIDFMANHRNSGKTDDFFYEFEYWQGDVISCTTMAYDDDELKSMTEGASFTSMGSTFKDRFILWNELPGFLKDKVKDYWGSKADMLYEWACEVEVDTDDDDFDVDIDDDYFDIENKTASNEKYFSSSVVIDSDSENWKNNINLDGSYNLEVPILNDCLDYFRNDYSDNLRDSVSLREIEITDEAKEEIRAIANEMMNDYKSGYNVCYELVYQGSFFPDDEKAVIDNVHIWER